MRIDPVTGQPIPGDANADAASKTGKFRPVRDMKAKLNEDVSIMQNDPAKLGLTGAVKSQMQGEAQQADAMARQNQIQQLGSQALAGTPIAQNQLQDAATNIGAQGGEAAAKTSADINKLNSRLVEQRKAQITMQMETARMNERQKAQFWSQFALDSAGTVASVVTGLA